MDVSVDLNTTVADFLMDMISSYNDSSYGTTLTEMNFNGSSYNDSSYGTTLMEMNSSYNGINLSFTSASPPTRRHDITKYRKYYYPVLATEMVLSVICLILTIVVYTILSEYRNIHGKNLISLSASLLTTFTFLSLDLLGRKKLSPSVCFSVGVIIHVTFLATFFWTNVMAFDIWRTMANLRPKSESPRNSTKYRNYSIYAWIATILTALPAVVLDQTNAMPQEYKPNLGMRRCWLSGTKSVLLYFNAPVGIILFCNLTMFLLTTWKLIVIKKITQRLNIEQQKQRFFLYLKLFFVMGIIWIAEFLPWATGVYALYLLAGILNCSNGILLFVIFVCKKRILIQVLEKLKIRQKEQVNNSNASQQTTSSCRSNQSTKV